MAMVANANDYRGHRNLSFDALLSFDETATDLTENMSDLNDSTRSKHKSDTCTRNSSLNKDCPSFLRLASHHNILKQEDLDRCEAYAIQKSSLAIGRPIGQGSLGEVRFAHQDGRPVAVKTLCSQLDVRSEEGKDLLKEIGMMSHAFRHSNVVEFYGIYEHDGLPWLVMELMPGGSLEHYYEAKKRSRRDGRWRPKTRRAVSWVEDILRALAYLHSQTPPVIHRDIKPANMLLTGDGRTVKIGDFGLSRMCPDSRRRSSVTARSGREAGPHGGDVAGPELTRGTGTYRYMAPEIFRGEARYTAAVDVYSFALVMWYIFAGEHPFSNVDGHTVTSMAATHDFRPAVLSERMMPRQLQEAMRRSWAGRAEERPTAEELLEEVDSLQRRKKGGCMSYLAGGKGRG